MSDLISGGPSIICANTSPMYLSLSRSFNVPLMVYDGNAEDFLGWTDSYVFTSFKCLKATSKKTDDILRLTRELEVSLAPSSGIFEVACLR